MEAEQQGTRPPVPLLQHKSTSICFLYCNSCKISLGKKMDHCQTEKKRKKLETTNYTIMYEIRKKIRINGILTVIKMINGR